jgi:hypothetical protein
LYLKDYRKLQSQAHHPAAWLIIYHPPSSPHTIQSPDAYRRQRGGSAMFCKQVTNFKHTINTTKAWDSCKICQTLLLKDEDWKVQSPLWLELANLIKWWIKIRNSHLYLWILLYFVCVCVCVRGFVHKLISCLRPSLEISLEHSD